MKPYAALYSTFLQRAYDQVVHDVAVQKLPVRFAIDRAGFVGADGPTHAGSFDVAYLINLPDFVLMAASDGQELVKMINTANSIDDCPSAFRFPRGDAAFEINFNDDEILEIGKAKVVQKGERVALISYGAILTNTLAAAKILKEENGLKITIIDARFAKPFDEKLFTEIAKTHDAFITIEEGAIGGFGCAVSKFLQDEGLLDDGKCKFRQLVMADKFVEQNKVDVMQSEAGIGILDIVEVVNKVLLISKNY